MKHFKINLEVPAGLGEKSILERAPGVPLKVVKLHLVFEGWLGSDLLETSPVFYVTKKLKEGLENSELSGIKAFENIEVTKSDNFVELYPDKELPDFFLLRLNGVAYKDDFGVDKGTLVISEKTKELLGAYSLIGADIEEV